MIKHLDEIVKVAREKGKQRLVVAYGQDLHSIEASSMAIQAGIAEVTLIGDPEVIAKNCKEYGVDCSEYTIIPEKSDVKCVELAVKRVNEGLADVLMKGLVSTDKYMRGILNKEWGLLPPKATLSHVTVMEIPAYHKLLIIGDVAVIPAPDFAQKRAITSYLIHTANSLGITLPKVAFITPSEQLLPKVPSSVEAAMLSVMGHRGQLGKAEFDGPLAMDVAIDKESADIKGLGGNVVGDADCLLFPNIEAGNVFFKACAKFGGGELAAIVTGTKAPCVLTSRGDSSKSKLYSIALACLSVK